MQVAQSLGPGATRGPEPCSGTTASPLLPGSVSRPVAPAPDRHTWPGAADFPRPPRTCHHRPLQAHQRPKRCRGLPGSCHMTCHVTGRCPGLFRPISYPCHLPPTSRLGHVGETGALVAGFLCHTTWEGHPPRHPLVRKGQTSGPAAGGRGGAGRGEGLGQNIAVQSRFLASSPASLHVSQQPGSHGTVVLGTQNTPGSGTVSFDPGTASGRL